MEGANRGSEPSTTRALAGLRQDGMPLYLCEACGRTLAMEAFDIRTDGTPHDLCRRCAAIQRRGRHGWAANMPKRPNTIAESKECSGCGQVKEARFFWADKKMADGLFKQCIACTKQHRRKVQAGEEEPWKPGRPARPLPEQVQPILDQAIAERDASVRELEQLKQTLNGRDMSDATMPDDVVVALTRIEAMCASMAGQMLDREQQPRPSALQGWLCRGMRRAADALARAAGELDRRAGGQ